MNFSMRLKIRDVYRKHTPALISGERKCPYSLGIDWWGKFSPIEDYVWDAIRYNSLPLYPQYPVGKYFIDFADPARKIGIEVDSVTWHKDLEKDQKRQADIERMGWKIYRIPSWMTFKQREDFTDEDGNVDIEKFQKGSAEGYLLWIYRNENYLQWHMGVIG